MTRIAPILLLNLWTLAGAAEPSDRISSPSAAGEDLLLQVSRPLHEERRLRWYQALAAEKSEPLACWLSFIEEGGLDLGSITLEDIQLADRDKAMKVVARENEVTAILEFGTQSRVLLKDKLEDDTLEKMNVAQIQKHSWVLTMRFDPKSHALRNWDLKFGYGKAEKVK